MADDVVPSGSFGDYSEENSNAKPGVKNYEVCQFSGFKVRPENLVKNWDGAWVHKDLRDIRNPQDALKHRPEKPRASKRQELPNQLIEQSLYLLTEAGEYIALEAEEGFLRTEGRHQVLASDL